MKLLIFTHILAAAGGGALVYFYYAKAIYAGKEALKVIEGGIGKAMSKAKQVL